MTQDEKALFEAIRDNDSEAMKRLLDKRVNINARNEDGCTALICACYKNIGTAKLLIEAGADVYTVDEEGETALMTASRRGNLEVVKLLIEKGADVNAENKAEWTALMRASMDGHLEVAKFLVESGANINDICCWGTTALMLASIRGHLEIVELLIETGADINIKDQCGATALISAIKGKHKKTAQLWVNRCKGTKHDIGFLAMLCFIREITILVNVKIIIRLRYNFVR